MTENAPTRSLDDIDLAALRVSNVHLPAPARGLHTQTNHNSLIGAIIMGQEG